MTVVDAQPGLQPEEIITTTPEMFDVARQVQYGRAAVVHSAQILAYAKLCPNEEEFADIGRVKVDSYEQQRLYSTAAAAHITGRAESTHPEDPDQQIQFGAELAIAETSLRLVAHQTFAEDLGVDLDQHPLIVEMLDPKFEVVKAEFDNSLEFHAKPELNAAGIIFMSVKDYTRKTLAAESRVVEAIVEASIEKQDPRFLRALKLV